MKTWTKNIKIYLILILIVLYSRTAIPNCGNAITLLGDDMKGVVLTRSQTEEIFTILFEARRLCSLGQEEKALKQINYARRLAGIGESSGEFDWENVPLESLEIE